MRLLEFYQTISEEYSELATLFDKTAGAQRGDPERAMINLQMFLGGGVFDYVLEHVGDITHRMTEKFDFLKGSHANVQDKVEKTLRTLEHNYGFEREMEENMQNNFRFSVENGKPKAGSFIEFMQKIQTMSSEYAKAHEQIPVHNEPQKRARQAAIDLGNWDFDGARSNLNWLKQLLQDEELYTQAVSQTNLQAYEGYHGANQFSQDETSGMVGFPLPQDSVEYDKDMEEEKNKRKKRPIRKRR